MKKLLGLIILVTGLATGLSAQTKPTLVTVHPFAADPVLSTVHLGLGWATIASALATGVLGPERAGLQIHQTLGYITAGLAAATMVAGIWAHWGDVGLSYSWDNPDNIHALLGAAGGTMMMIAPFVAPNTLHKTLGEAGGFFMGVAVVWKLVF